MNKLIIISYLFLISTLTSLGQTVHIPDTNFLLTLLNAGVDTDDDGMIQVAEAEAVSDLTFGIWRVASLEGIEAFVNLKTLDCQFSALTTLDLSGNPLLEELSCPSNNLTSIDLTMNKCLKSIICFGNELASLDVTNNPVLENLNCLANQLTSLDISSNPLLKTLSCQSNELSTLDLSSNPLLKDLSCYGNLLASLDVSNNPLLTLLTCYDNDLNSLDVTSNSLLESLACNKNQISTLNVTSNPLLRALSCHENDLTTLNVTSNPLLEILWCYANELTTLDVTVNPLLENFNCGFNKLSTLDVTGNPRLEYFICWLNEFSTLDLSQNSELVSFGLLSSDSLDIICVNADNMQLVLDELAEEGLKQTVVSLYCHYGDFVAYQPKVGLSINAICDAIFYLDQTRLTIAFNNDTSCFLYTGSGNIYLPLTGEPITIWASSPDSTLYTVIDSVYTLDSMTLAQGLDSMDVYQDTLCAIVHVAAYDGVQTLTPVDVPRPGFDVTYKMLYENRGTLPVSGTLGMKYDSALVTFIDAEIIPDAHIGDSLTWSYAELQPFEQRAFTLDFRLNSPMDIPSLNGGDQIEYDVCIKPIIDDHHPDDNCYVLSQTVVNSYDPNDKQCLQGGQLSPDMVGSWLTYMIRFENTGSAEAVTVRVTDEIDLAVFDINSLTPVDASHAYHIEIHNDNQVHFVFPGIYLPFDDANNDGYVTFRIRTLDHLILGDEITNQASIFFDFNLPIETNTALTEVKDLEVSTITPKTNDIKIKYSPNPTSDEVLVSSPYPIKEVILINGAGQIIRRITPLDPNFALKISLKDFGAGNYLLQAKTTHGTGIEKIIVD